MTCSVKSLAPMTMCEERGGAQAARVMRAMERSTARFMLGAPRRAFR